MKAMSNKAAPVNAPIASWFQFGHAWHVTEHRRSVSHITTFMKTKIDIKSALIGLLLGIVATVAIAAASSPSQVGRYQISGAGSFGLVLDTATGQVWTMFFSSSGGRNDGEAFYQPKAGITK